MEKKILLIIIFFITFTSILMAQKLYRVDYGGQSYGFNNPIKTLYINQFGKVVYKPDSTLFLNGSQVSRVGVIAVEYKLNDSHNKVVLVDSMGKEFKTFEGYNLCNFNHNLNPQNFHSIISRGFSKIYNVAPTFLINQHGDIIYKFPGNETEPQKYIGEGFFSYKKEGFYYLDNTVSPPYKFSIKLLGDTWIQDVSNGLIKFQYNYNSEKWPTPPNKKFGYMNLNKEVIIKPQFDFATTFSNNRAFIYSKPNEMKLIDTKGNIVSDKTFYTTYEKFNEGVMSIKVYPDDSTYSYIDTTGASYLTEKYKYASQFIHGRALVSKDNDSYFLINKKGEKVSGNFFQAGDTWWDENILYDSFSGEFYNLNLNKSVFKRPNHQIYISKDYQLNHFNNLESVYSLYINGIIYNKGKNAVLSEKINRLKNLQEVTLFVDDRTKGIDLTPIFNLGSLKKLKITYPYFFSLDKLTNLKKLEFLEIDITNYKSLPNSFKSLKNLKSLTLNGVPQTTFVNQLYSLNKNIELIIINHHYIDNKDIIKLSKHFKVIRNAYGEVLKNNQIENPVLIKD